MKQIDNAAKEAETAQIVLPDDPSVNLVAGCTLLAQGKPKQAFMPLVTGLEKDPYNFKFYLPLAHAAIDSNVANWTQYGLAASERSYKMGKSREANLLFSRALIAYGRPQEAIGNLTPLIAKGSKDAEALYLTGLALVSAGQKEEGKRTMDDALKIDPAVAKKVTIPPAGPSVPSGRSSRQRPGTPMRSAVPAAAAPSMPATSPPSAAQPGSENTGTTAAAQKPGNAPVNEPSATATKPPDAQPTKPGTTTSAAPPAATPTKFAHPPESKH